jgi:rhomboid protease GluP
MDELTVVPVCRVATRARADELLLVLESQGIVGWRRFDPVGALDPWLIEVGSSADAVIAQQHFDEIAEEKPLRAVEPTTPMPGDKAGTYWVVGLILSSILPFWAMSSAPGGSESLRTLLGFGAIHSSLVAQGQWWRLVTAMFLHIGFRHLLGNMLLLGVLGFLVLRMWGPGRLLFVYLAGGLIGNLAGFWFGSATAVKAGASGAILALLGGMAADRLRSVIKGLAPRVKWWHILAMLVAFYGMVVGIRPESDHIAHVGGIVGGGWVAVLLPPAGSLGERAEKRLQLGTLLASAALLSAALVPALSTLR